MRGDALGWVGGELRCRASLLGFGRFVLSEEDGKRSESGCGLVVLHVCRDDEIGAHSWSPQTWWAALFVFRIVAYERAVV